MTYLESSLIERMDADRNMGVPDADWTFVMACVQHKGS